MRRAHRPRAEKAVIDAALAGHTVTRQTVRGSAIRGALIRELLSGAHGALHWRGLRFEGVHITGDVDLSYCKWHGALRLLACDIDGDVDLSYADAYGAIILNRSHVNAIVAANLRLQGSLQFTGGLAEGGLWGTGMTLSGVLNLDRATLVAPADKPSRMAVGLYRARLDDLYMTRTLLIGGFFGNGMTVQRNVRLSAVAAMSRKDLGLPLGADTKTGYAVSLAGAKIGGALNLFSKNKQTDPPRLIGGLSLARVTCVTLQARVADVAGTRLDVDHLVFERLSGMEAREWLTVLTNQPEAATQPYRHLAQMCDANGQFRHARDVRIALQRRIDREAPGTRFNRFRRQVLRVTVAYGYRAGWALGWLLLVSVLAVAVLAASNGFMVHEQAEGAAVRGFGSVEEATAFTVDSLLPFARLGTTDAWSADPRNVLDVVALGVFVTLKGLAWALAALALAATTGLVRRD